MLVLDFFAGSGSTGEAVVALNADDGGTRRFVLVTRDEEEDAGKGKTGRRLCRDVAYPRLTGQFALENEDGSLRVAQADEMSAAVRAGADGIVAGGVCGKYGASLRFLQATARSISRHEATVRDLAARAVSEIAADTLRVITDCWGRHPASTEEFEIFASEARLLVVLHRYAARARLVTALVAIDSEKQIVIYPSLPGGVADEGWFSKRLGARAEVRPLPDPILRTYNNLVLEARR